MKARPTYVPRLEKLEDRSIPGSLLGLADLPAELFGDLLAPAKRPAIASSAEFRTSGFPQAAPAAAGQVPRSPAAALRPAKASSFPLAPAVVATSADPLGLALAAATSRAPHAPRAEIRTSDDSRAYAFGNWTEGCLTTNVALLAYRATQRSWPTRETDGVSALHGLNVLVIDNCREAILLDVQGFATDPSMFHAAPNHRSASFSGTIVTLNLPTGTLIDFSISLNWTATGRPVSETIVAPFEDSVTVLHTQDWPAVATGSISDGMTNYILGPISDAVIGRTQSVEVTF